MPVGYPPYIYTSYFKKYIESNYALKVVIGPIDFLEYFLTGENFGIWNSQEWHGLLNQ
jgi:predicted small integral membrane protein